MAQDISYTPEEKVKVINFWNSRLDNLPTLMEIVSHFSDGQENDPRTLVGRKVRAILLEAQIKPQNTIKERVEEFPLSDEDKEFILNNMVNNSAFEMARTLWEEKLNRKIWPVGREVRAIQKYLSDMKKSAEDVKDKEQQEKLKIFEESEDILTGERYAPPHKLSSVLALVNRVSNAGLNPNNLNAFEKKSLEFVSQCLHAPRFIQEMNNYKTVEKRITFQAEFVRSIWEKNDLISDEITLILNWCGDIIEVADSKKQAEKLKVILDTVTNDTEGKVAMSLVESINGINSHINEVLKRQALVYGLINKSRARRDEEKTNRHASLSALFEWYREEDNRKKMLNQAKILKDNKDVEIKRLESLDDVIFLSLGLGSSSEL